LEFHVLEACLGFFESLRLGLFLVFGDLLLSWLFVSLREVADVRNGDDEGLAWFAKVLANLKNCLYDLPLLDNRESVANLV